MFSSRLNHNRLPRRDSENQDSEALLPGSSSSASLPLKPGPPDRSSRDVRIAVRTLVLCTIVYVGATLWITSKVNKATLIANPDDFCIHHVSQYSPVVRDVKPNWHTQLFNGSFLHQNIYRQPAGPEVDAAWDALGINYRSVVIPEAEAERTGLRHDQVKVSQEYGGGFPANVEGLHHLHCLDLLRKTLHWNYDYYLAQKQGAFVNSEYIVRVHATHCLDTIRQVLMWVLGYSTLVRWLTSFVAGATRMWVFWARYGGSPTASQILCRLLISIRSIGVVTMMLYGDGQRRISCRQKRRWTWPGSMRCPRRGTRFWVSFHEATVGAGACQADGQ
ncbi:hypothetical protein ACJBU6_07662 [Exserohilum turcicum]